ncbi:16723_t:CDS:2, partial [Acaulospora colombiana]
MPFGSVARELADYLRRREAVYGVRDPPIRASVQPEFAGFVRRGPASPRTIPMITQRIKGGITMAILAALDNLLDG